MAAASGSVRHSRRGGFIDYLLRGNRGPDATGVGPTSWRMVP